MFQYEFVFFQRFAVRLYMHSVLFILHVTQIHLPFLFQDYIHRVGRTARAGRSGKSITFVTQ